MRSSRSRCQVEHLGVVIAAFQPSALPSSRECRDFVGELRDGRGMPNPNRVRQRTAMVKRARAVGRDRRPESRAIENPIARGRLAAALGVECQAPEVRIWVADLDAMPVPPPEHVGVRMRPER